MPVQYDIFFNYSPEDNTQNHPEGSCWVERFALFVQKVAAEMLLRPISIALDLDPDNIPHAAVYINILTNNFFKDQNCLSRLEVIQKQNTKLQRVFAISRTPLTQFYNLLKDQRVYPFFFRNPKTLEIEQFNEFEGESVSESGGFWLALIDLCYDLTDSIRNYTGDNQSLPAKGVVYLSGNTLDVNEQRILVKRELHRYGYTVLPEQTLPQRVTDATMAIREELSKCTFSIQLIGKDYGSPLEGAKISMSELENQLCEEYQNLYNQVHSDYFRRIVWLDPATNDGLGEKQAALIEKIKRSALNQELTEIVQCRIEDFKSILLQRLAIKPQEIDLTPKSTEEHPKIYIMTDQRDISFANSLYEFLVNEQYEVLILPEGIHGQDRQNLHRKYLVDCHVALICYNNAKKTWLITKLQDILKAPGLGRRLPLKTSLVVTMESDNEQVINSVLSQYPQYNGIQFVAADQSAAFARLKDILG